MQFSFFFSFPFSFLGVFRSWWVQLWINLDHLLFLAVASPENSLSSHRGLASINGARSTRAECVQSRDLLALSVAETRGLHQRHFLHICCLFVFPSSQTWKGEKESTRRKKRVSCSSFSPALESIILSSAYLLLFFCLISDLSLLAWERNARAYLLQVCAAARFGLSATCAECHHRKRCLCI